MSAVGLIAGVLLLTVLMIWVAMPLFERRASAGAESAQRQRETLSLSYERALRNVRDLDEDYALGKLNPEEYAADREHWVARGAQILRALDALDAARPAAPAGADDTATDPAVDRDIEEDISSYRRRIESS